MATPWANAQVAHLLSVQRATAMVEDRQTAEKSGPSEYNEVVITKNAETIDAFSSHVILVKMERAYLRGRVNVMTQALQVEDGSLPQRLTVQNAYMELRTDSKTTAVVVVRNSTAYPQTLKRKTPVAWAVATTAMSEPPVMTQLLEGEEPHISQSPRLTVRQRQGRLLEELDLNWLGIMAPRIGRFCPITLGGIPWCLFTGTGQTGLYPFYWACNKNYWMIPLSRNNLNRFPHLWWKRSIANCMRCWIWVLYNPARVCVCNAVVLVRKKDGSLHFCINFHHLNACIKKASYPLPRIQEALEHLAGAGYFSFLDLKLWFWQIKMEEASKPYTTFTIGNLGFFECHHMPFGLCNALATFQRLRQNCLGELNIVYCLIYLDDIVIFLQMVEKTSTPVVGGLWPI